ncbi:hypothetical protein JCM10213_001383 [Rhodosporidiobolus nylandii]
MLSPLDKQLLQADTTFFVDPATLDTLSATQLALAAARVDLPSSTRQLARTAFEERRRVARSGQSAAVDEPILAFEPDFIPPASLSAYTPTQLLLMPFNRHCTFPDLAATATARFFDLAEEAKATARATARLELQRYEIRWDGGSREETESLRLRAEGYEMKLLWAGEDIGEERLDYRIAAEDIEAVNRAHSFFVLRTYLADIRLPQDAVEEDEDGGATSAVFVFRLAKATTSVPRHWIPSPILRLQLSVNEEAEEELEMLMKQIGRWKKEVGFELGQQRSSARSSGKARPSDSSSSSQSPSKRAQLSSTIATSQPTLSHSTSLPLTSATSASVSVPPPSPGLLNQRSHLSPSVLRKILPAWQYVSAKPAPAEWQAGFFVRQWAFLESVAPYLQFTTPHFTPEETALLTFLPDRAKLPPVPRRLPPTPGEVAFQRQFSKFERFAVEHLYRNVRRTDAQDVGAVIRGADPALSSYIQVLAKLVTAREATDIAYRRVLRERLYPGENNPTTADPLESLVSLFDSLSDDPSSRKTRFSTGFSSLSSSSSFSQAELGIGPLRRYEAKLELIVEYEDGLRRAFEQGEEREREKQGR